MLSQLCRLLSPHQERRLLEAEILDQAGYLGDQSCPAQVSGTELPRGTSDWCQVILTECGTIYFQAIKSPSLISSRFDFGS